MVSDFPQLKGARCIQEWFSHAPETLWADVEDALQALLDGTWRERYLVLADLTTPPTEILVLSDTLVVVWRPVAEYPLHRRIVYIGDPDEADLYREPRMP